MEPEPYDVYMRCLFCTEKIASDTCYTKKFDFPDAMRLFCMLNWNADPGNHPPLPICEACAKDKPRRSRMSRENSRSIFKRIMPQANLDEAAFKLLEERIRSGEFKK